MPQLTILHSTRVVLADPLWRVFFLILLFQGFGSGGAVPFVSLWASNALGADPVEIGLLRTVSGIAGVGYGLALGAVTDRTRRRSPWIVGGMAAAVLGWGGAALAGDMIVGTLMFTLASLGSFTLIFALLGDWIRYRESENATMVNSTVRLSFALGWLGGPAVAGVVVSAFGYVPLLLGTAALQAIAVVMAARWLRDPPVVAPKPGVAKPDAAAGRAAYVSLWLFVLACFFASAASPSRFVLVPLYITDYLGQTVAMVGIVFTISVLFELPLFPMVAHWTERFGIGRMLGLGFAAYGLYFLGVSLTEVYWPLLGLEFLFAFNVATTNGVGMLYIQNLVPTRAGTAIALYGAAQNLGGVVSAPLLGLLQRDVSWDAAFYASTILCALSVVAFVFSLRALKGQRPTGSG